MSTSKIEWTEETWNPVAGCSLVSPGCTNCYAMRMASRLEAMGQTKYAGTTKKVNGLSVWTGKINLADDALAIPLKRSKPTMWFVNSMSDLFHKDVPFEYIDKVFAVMALTPQHTYQILTKRTERMAEYTAATYLPGGVLVALDQMESGIEATGAQWPLPNVWLGTSCEDQQRADERIPHLLKCPAAVRFLSCEPLLGPIDFGDEDEIHGPFNRLDLGLIHWVIVGGESGPGARPMNVEWARSIVEQCKAAGAACFVKQLGAHPICNDVDREMHADGTLFNEGIHKDEWHMTLRDKKGNYIPDSPL
jgi:protein gp37